MTSTTQNRENAGGGIALSGQEKHLLLEAWYQQYSKVLLLYACQFVDYHSAEEVVQETFRVAWETIQEKEIEYPKTWLRKITKNVIKNRVRERERWKDLLANVDEVPEEALGKSEDPINVELEYEGLIDRQDLHLLKLLAVDGYTYSEAAKALDTTVEACRKRAKRAEQKLRKLLGK